MDAGNSDLPFNVARVTPDAWGEALRGAFAWLCDEPLRATSAEKIISRPQARGYVGLAYTTPKLQITPWVEGWSGCFDLDIQIIDTSDSRATQPICRSYLEAAAGIPLPAPVDPDSIEDSPRSMLEAVRPCFDLAALLWQFRNDLLTGDAEAWQRVYRASMERNREYTRRPAE